MALHAWQTICQVLVAVGLIFTAIGGFGAYFCGKQIDQTERQEEQADKERLAAKTDEILEHLKKVTISGDEQLTSQIRKPGKWDFSVGTIVFWVRKQVFTNREGLSLQVISENNDASIAFVKEPNNKIMFIYSFPTIGKIVRQTQVVETDLQEKGVHFGFTWDLSEAKTTLYINGKERQ